MTRGERRKRRERGWRWRWKGLIFETRSYPQLPVPVWSCFSPVVRNYSAWTACNLAPARLARLGVPGSAGSANQRRRKNNASDFLLSRVSDQGSDSLPSALVLRVRGFHGQIPIASYQTPISCYRPSGSIQGPKVKRSTLQNPQCAMPPSATQRLGREAHYVLSMGLIQ